MFNTTKKPGDNSPPSKDNNLNETEEFLATVSSMHPEQVFTRADSRHHSADSRHHSTSTPASRKDSRTEQTDSRHMARKDSRTEQHQTPASRKDSKTEQNPGKVTSSRTEQFLRMLEERNYTALTTQPGGEHLPPSQPPDNQPKTTSSSSTTPPAPTNKTRNVALMRRTQRQASDTDLLRSLRERQEPFPTSRGSTQELTPLRPEPFRTSLGSTQELSPDGDKVFVNTDPGFPALPQLSEASPSKSSATPPEKRVLDQKEFDKKLKAKRAIFSKSRSISLASFKLPKLKINDKTLPKVEEKRQEKENAEIAAMEPVRGELDMIDFAQLINVKDL